MKNKPNSIIGIDPGVITGCAVWDTQKKQFETIFSGGILEVQRRLEIYAVFGSNVFYIENPSLRKWYGKNSSAKLQGAGSIKRDFSIWLEWFEIHSCNYQELNPKDIKTKVNANSFKNFTGWTEKTNEHSRDAAMMVFGK